MTDDEQSVESADEVDAVDTGPGGSEVGSPQGPRAGEQEEGKRVDRGSATGGPGVSGTEATDFRVDEKRSADDEAE